jgi:hypothetical protein
MRNGLMRSRRGKRKAVSAPGCDDAPVIEIKRLADDWLAVPKPLTLIMPYYENPLTLAAHLERWHGWSSAARAHIKAFIVDDGSPVNPAESVLKTVDCPIPVRLFRIDVDVRWNWLAARNLAFHLADDAWNVVTDIDHIIPPETAEALIWGDHNPRAIYRFSRQEHTGEDIAPHPNSWFLTREMYWRIGGHDEALSGHYGTDGEYRRRAAKTAPIRIMTDKLIREEFVGDSSTTRYLRKQPQDRAVASIVAARGKDWKPKVLSFPWHEVVL